MGFTALLLVVGMLASIFLVIGVYNLGFQDGRFEKSEHRIETDVHNRVWAECSDRTTSGTIKCSYDRLETNYKETLPERNVSARIRMAIWTQKLGLVGGFSLILSSVGIFLVARTLRASQKAANAATATNQAFLIAEGGRPTLTGASREPGKITFVLENNSKSEIRLTSAQADETIKGMAFNGDVEIKNVLLKPIAKSLIVFEIPRPDIKSLTTPAEQTLPEFWELEFEYRNVFGIVTERWTVDMRRPFLKDGAYSTNIVALESRKITIDNTEFASSSTDVRDTQ